MKYIAVGDIVEVNNSRNTVLTLGKSYEVEELSESAISIKVKGSPVFYNISRFSIVSMVRRVAVDENDNLWDFMEKEVEGVCRRTLKTVVFSIIMEGSILTVAKDNKLSLQSLSQIVSAFNEWTGYEEGVK